MARRTHKSEDEDKITKSRMFVDQDAAAGLSAAYEKALKEGKTSFMFEGEDVNVMYAKYMLSYLKQNGYQI
tara:strand:- start:3426 stop:3638 length:213 start_codon:yes stop_codon:yes gene_type:complete